MTIHPLVNSLYDRVWNSGDRSALDELVTDDFRFQGSLGPGLHCSSSMARAFAKSGCSAIRPRWIPALPRMPQSPKSDPAYSAALSFTLGQFSSARAIVPAASLSNRACTAGLKFR
jgi:hypothetical protein